MSINFTEGSGLQDSVFGKSQAPVRLFLEKRGEAYEQDSAIPKLFDISRSGHWSEKLTTLTAMDGFKAVGENGTYPSSDMQEGFSKTLEHMTWKNSFSLSREIADDATLLDLKKKPLGFIASYYRTRERFGAALFGGGLYGTTVTFGSASFSTASADGVSVFNKSHEGKDEVVQSNLYAAQFSLANLGALETKMQNFTGDNGEILDISPDTIIIPNEYNIKNAVFSAIGADKDPATANNGFNYQYGRWKIIVWPYLNAYIDEDDSPWILLDSRFNSEFGGAVWLDRTPLEVRSTIDETNDANVWRGYARFIAGFNDWRFAIAGGVTGGSTL